MIPPFDPETRNLPAGVYEATWEEFTARFGFTAHRQKLITGLEAALRALRDAGCTRVWVDGSFVGQKEVPGDFDACWDATGVDKERLDPVLLDLSNSRATQKEKYGGALWPAEATPDEAAGRTVLESFHYDYWTGKPKGIIVLNPQSL